MQRLGENLETLFNKCHRRFSLSTVLQLADKMLNLIRKVHTEGFVHRDIKPDNFVIGGDGEGEKDEVYIIDFGLSKCYMNPQTKQHIEFRTDKHLTGTARYASVANHRGEEQSRRDDLESLGYVLVYFLKGVLPWQNIRKTTPEHKKYRGMMHVKIATVHTSLELVNGLPDAFAKYFAHVKQLKFDETPDYRYLRRLFYDCFVSSVDTDLGESNCNVEDGRTRVTQVPAHGRSKVARRHPSQLDEGAGLDVQRSARQMNRGSSNHVFDWQFEN
jgi:serine/threonine protein kinase